MSRRRGPSGEVPAVPLYVVTGGEDGKEGHLVLDLVTLVVARSSPAAGMCPEREAIVRMCGRPLSVAELSAHLELPFSAVGVLVAELLDGDQVTVRQTRQEQRQAAAEPDLETLKALIDGLQRL